MFDRVVGSVARQARAAAVALTMVSLVVSGAAGWNGASVALAAVEPSSIALVPADLPPGFVIDQSRTSDDVVDGVGPRHIRSLARDATPANVASGPVFVIQSVIRLDSGLGAGDALRLQRDYWVNRVGYSPTSAGPNDGGTFSLVKRDNGVVSYVVGFIKENMIIVTIAGGADGVVQYQDAVAYAGKTSAKLDAALGR
ncbi:MAG: hypothetical protein U0893_20455 [Chloroflexota bacterium]